MKWNIFQTKKLDSFLTADFFAQVTNNFDQSIFKGVKPVALVTLKDKTLDWIFEVNYWKKKEEIARKLFLAGKDDFVKEDRKNIAKVLKIMTLGFKKEENYENKLIILLKSAIDLMKVPLGPFENILPLLMREELKVIKNGLKALKIISILSQPEELIYISQFEIDFFNDCIEIKKKYPKLNSQIPFRQNRKVAKIVRKLYLKYFTLPVDTSGQPWSEEYFWKRIYRNINNNTTKQLIDKIKKAQKTELIAKKEKQKIFKQYNASKRLIFLSRIAGNMALLRDRRKSIIGVLVYFIYKYVNELSKIKQIPSGILHYYLISELIDLITKNKKVSLVEINKRKKSACFYIKDKKIEYLSGNCAQEFINKELGIQKIPNNVKEIKGIIGSVGEPVKGVVKVVLDQGDLSKMQKGDILVSIATNYDLVPAMSKAKAIVTDEGGILCHAAVVSRELQIPCIIATKFSSKILHDGDFVEVNTNKGIVTIIRRAK